MIIAARLLPNIRQHLQRQQCSIASCDLEVLHPEAAVQNYEYRRQAAAQHMAAPAVTAEHRVI
jgi:hypothetical protein